MASISSWNEVKDRRYRLLAVLFSGSGFRRLTQCEDITSTRHVVGLLRSGRVTAQRGREGSVFPGVQYDPNVFRDWNYGSTRNERSERVRSYGNAPDDECMDMAVLFVYGEST